MIVADSVIVRPSISITGSSPDGTFAMNSAGFGLPGTQQQLACVGITVTSVEAHVIW